MLYASIYLNNLICGGLQEIKAEINVNLESQQTLTYYGYDFYASSEVKLPRSASKHDVNLVSGQ